MALVAMHDLMTVELKDWYRAETPLLRAIPRMADGAVTPRLRTACENHFEQTHEHDVRLKQIFELLDERACDMK